MFAIRSAMALALFGVVVVSGCDAKAKTTSSAGDASYAALEARLATLEARNTELEARITSLEGAAPTGVSWSQLSGHSRRPVELRRHGQVSP